MPKMHATKVNKHHRARYAYLMSAALKLGADARHSTKCHACSKATHQGFSDRCRHVWFSGSFWAVQCSFRHLWGVTASIFYRTFWRQSACSRSTVWHQPACLWRFLWDSSICSCIRSTSEPELPSTFIALLVDIYVSLYQCGAVYQCLVSTGSFC